jgi:hypothetical protein
MKMKIILIVFLITANIVNSQNKKIKGIIKDSETLQPIEFVSIYIESESNKNATGSISNENGEFFLSYNYKKVTFSHLNYETLTTNLTEKFNEIILKPKNLILDEIVISTITSRDYLKKIVSDANRKIEKNTLFKSYCREIVRINGEYTKFSDALVDYYVKKGNGKSIILLKEHRAFNILKFDDKDDSDISEINSVFKLKDYVKSAYNFGSLESILKNKDYKFERKLKKESNGKEFEFIKIIPNIKSKQLLNNGYVVIEPKTKNILEYKIYTSEDHRVNAKLINVIIAKVKVKNSLKWSKFKLIDDQYILTYNKRQVEMFIEMGKKVNHDFNFSSDLFVYGFKNNIKIPRKGYKKRTIYHAGTNYKEEFWKKYNAFPLTKSQKNFISTAKEK